MVTMTDQDDGVRATLRRTAYDLKCGLADLYERLGSIDPDAAHAAHRARLAAFEAWTILATPFEKDEDH